MAGRRASSSCSRSIKRILCYNITMQPLLKEKEVAKLLNMSVATIRKWRCCGQGPRFVKIAHSIRYRSEDVQAFMEGK